MNESRHQSYLRFPGDNSSRCWSNSKLEHKSDWQESLAAWGATWTRALTRIRIILRAYFTCHTDLVCSSLVSTGKKWKGCYGTICGATLGPDLLHRFWKRAVYQNALWREFYLTSHISHTFRGLSDFELTSWAHCLWHWQKLSSMTNIFW